MTVNVTLGRLETSEEEVAAATAPDATPPAAAAPAAPAGLSGLVGFEVGPIDDKAKQDFTLADNVSGVVVTKVTPNTDAYEKGFIAGLVISEVNQQKVASVSDLTDIVDEAHDAGRPAVLFKVTDPAGSSRFIAVQFGK
jgi:serine protease Do